MVLLGPFLKRCCGYSPAARLRRLSPVLAGGQRGRVITFATVSANIVNFAGNWR